MFFLFLFSYLFLADAVVVCCCCEGWVEVVETFGEEQWLFHTALFLRNAAAQAARKV